MEQREPDGRNSVFGTTLTIVSTILGGGIVSIPYAYAVVGTFTGVAIQVGVCIAIYISCTLYLKTKSILRCSSSFDVIANLCLASVSGILLNLLLMFAVFGIMTLYVLLFAKICLSLVGSAYPEDHILASKTFYILVLGILVSPIIIRKKI